MMLPYKNEPFVDFQHPEQVKAMKAAFALVDSQKGLHCPLVINGERVDTQDKIKSFNPSKFTEVLGTAASATVALAEKAVQAALEAFKTWSKVPAKQRADIFFKAAALIRRRKLEFSAWLVEESGKNWQEADGDTAEAIDFLEYYARQMLRIDTEGMPVSPIPGENNACSYIPLGVGLVVSPWNFPFAIMAGMTAAAALTGNTVILKPASLSPLVAYKFVELLEEAGLPKGVVNYLPGSGTVVGEHLVRHPKIRFINFTGSKAVGLRIHQQAAEIAPGQIWMKRVVAEMGGKDAIVVDSETDLEEAANGIVASAFGFQGQKCSACSRAIIVAEVYDQVAALVAEKTQALTVGPARTHGIAMGPVIDEKAYQSILSYIEKGKTEGHLIAGGEKGDPNGYFILPTVFKDVSPDAVIAQEEIFGPVLALIKAKDFDHALEIANHSEYGLTGSVYSRNREKLQKAREDFHVGNLYLNRKCTGALVGVHPFGGFNMSGTDSKAGGSDYLLLFMQAKSISEKL